MTHSQFSGKSGSTRGRNCCARECNVTGRRLSRLQQPQSIVSTAFHEMGIAAARACTRCIRRRRNRSIRSRQITIFAPLSAHSQAHLQRIANRPKRLLVPCSSLRHEILVRSSLVPVILSATLCFGHCAARMRSASPTPRNPYSPGGTWEMSGGVPPIASVDQWRRSQQQSFNLWEFREELEYGVTDNYAFRSTSITNTEN